MGRREQSTPRRAAVALAVAGLALVACGSPVAPPVLLARPFADVTPATAAMPGVLKPGSVNDYTGGFFADLDGDGVDKLVLLGPTGAAAYDYDAESQRFAPMPFAPDLDPSLEAMADLDADGTLDGVTTGATVMWDADSLAANQSSSGRQDVGLADVDLDGWTDLLVADNSAPGLGVWLRAGVRSFTPLDAAHLPATQSMRPYVVAALPLTPGHPVIAELGDVPDYQHAAPAFYRWTHDDAAGLPVYEAFDPMPADAAFRQGLSGSDSINARAPMGAAVGDLDGDGRFDLFVSTDPFHELLQGRTAFPFAERSPASGIFRVAGPHNFELPWGADIVDVDLDGRPDLVVAHGDDESSHTEADHFIGPQSFGVYLNDGDFTFGDATAAAHVATGQYHGLAAGDFDCDGDADFVLGGYDQWPRVLRNDSSEVATGLSLDLHGSSSAEVPVGAVVDVQPEDGGRLQHLVVGGVASATMWAEPWVFAGLGKAKHADVTIHWPSGYVQRLAAVAGGRCLRVVEPRLFTINPPERSVSVGDDIRLFVTPRTPDGALNLSATVAAQVDGGARATVQPADGGFEVTVTGPSAPGSARVQLVLDGKALTVRPRLVWRAP